MTNNKVKFDRQAYQELANKLTVLDHDYRFRLSTGNCGVYAIALQKFLGFGELVEFDDFSHVLLKIDDDEYLDGEGIHTEQELRNHEKWRIYFNKRTKILPTHPLAILEGTAIHRQPISVYQMKRIIRDNQAKPLLPDTPI